MWKEPETVSLFSASIFLFVRTGALHSLERESGSWAGVALRAVAGEVGGVLVHFDSETVKVIKDFHHSKLQMPSAVETLLCECHFPPDAG